MPKIKLSGHKIGFEFMLANFWLRKLKRPSLGLIKDPFKTGAPMDRRQLLKASALSTMLASLGVCTVNQPQNLIDLELIEWVIKTHPQKLSSQPVSSI